MAISNFFQSSGGTSRGQSTELSTIEVQFTNQSSVTITHTFSSKPIVTIVDSNGYVIVGDIQYTSDTQIIVNFSTNLTGTIFLR